MPLLLWTLLLLASASPLVDAVRQHDLDTVRALLERGVDVNTPAGDGATALHWAVYYDDDQLVTRLLAAGADPRAANDLAITPLHLASANGNPAITRALLARGAEPDVASETGVTPLMEAARNGNVETVRALLDAGAQINRHERTRAQTALMWAVARQHADVVQTLVARGADVHARTRTRQLTVMLDQGPRRTVKTSRQDARQIDAGGTTALLFAAQVGDLASARHLLAAGARVDDAAGDGNTPLVSAAFAGRPEVAAALIAAGADVNAAGVGYTALHAAALRGDLRTVSALIASGADVHATISKGSPVRRFGSQWALPTPLTGATPLFVAAAYLEIPVMQALVAAGARPTAGLPNGTTALLAAAGVAVEKEARPSDLERWNLVDSDSPVVPRAEDDVLAAVVLLLDAGAHPDEANDAGDTALHAAAGAGMTRVIQQLADRGATLDVKNKNGQTPLALTLPRPRQPGGPAAAPGSKAAEDLLRKLGATQ